VHFPRPVPPRRRQRLLRCSRRNLLLLLQERARELGVILHFETEIAR